MMQPLQRQSPTVPQSVFKFKPFLISFIFCFIFLIAWIAFFVQTSNYCWGNCLGDYDFFFPCESYGALYCCSITQTYAPYQCGGSFYTSCKLDNTVCGTYRDWSIACGLLCFLSWAGMILAYCRFRRIKQRMLIAQIQQINQQQYGNNQQQPNNNYPAYPNNNANPYALQPAQNNPYNQPNNPYNQPNNANNQPNNRPNVYVPPSPNSINRN